MQYFKKIPFISAMSLLLTISLSYADWPKFPVLTADQVYSAIHTDGCPKGAGKILSGTQFAIINRYIPKNEHWYWDYEGDGACYKLPEKFSYVDYQPYNAVKSAGKITTFYGATDGTLFKFIFKVPQGTCPEESCPWDCGPLGTQRPALNVGCAQDQK